MTFHSFHKHVAPLKTMKLYKSKREMLEGGLNSWNYKVNWQLWHTETHPSSHVLIERCLKNIRETCETPGLPG